MWTERGPYRTGIAQLTRRDRSKAVHSMCVCVCVCFVIESGSTNTEVQRPKDMTGKECSAINTNDILVVVDLPSGEILEDGRVIIGQKAIYQPTKEEWEEHMGAHIPFRKW